jgi:hypothetical protein
MKSSTSKKASYLDSFFDILYSQDDGNATILPVNTSFINSNFKSVQELINFNTDLYDAFHGRDGWVFSLLSGKLEKT